MTFEIDPRVCLRTGKELAGSNNRCCDYDHMYTDRPSGLAAELNERAGYQDFRVKANEKAQAGDYGENGLFAPEAYVMPPSPSDFREVLPAYQVEELRAINCAPQRSLYVPPGPNRRDSFTDMLRRVFGRSPV